MGSRLRGMMKVMLRARVLLTLGVVALLSGAQARAENLDAGKSGAKLFADTCAACHHGARGLTKGRFRLTLYLFLQQHYASNSSAAWELASYLESVDDASHGRPRTAAAKHAPATAPKSSASLRPPAPVPQR
jgi:mono/diheme cytochrome c family protein